MFLFYSSIDRWSLFIDRDYIFELHTEKYHSIAKKNDCSVYFFLFK